MWDTASVGHADRPISRAGESLQVVGVAGGRRCRPPGGRSRRHDPCICTTPGGAQWLCPAVPREELRGSRDPWPAVRVVLELLAMRSTTEACGPSSAASARLSGRRATNSSGPTIRQSVEAQTPRDRRAARPRGAKEDVGHRGLDPGV